MALSRSKTEAWREVLANEISDLVTGPRDEQMAMVHQIAEYKAYFDRWKAAKRKARDDQDWLVWSQYTGVVELIDEGSSPKLDFALLATSDSTQGRIEAFSRMVPLVAAERGGVTDLVWQPWIEWQRAEEKDRQLWESL